MFKTVIDHETAGFSDQFSFFPLQSGELRKRKSRKMTVINLLFLILKLSTEIS